MCEIKPLVSHAEAKLAPVNMGIDVLLARFRKLLLEYPQLDQLEKEEYDALLREIKQKDLEKFLPNLPLY